MNRIIQCFIACCLLLTFSDASAQSVGQPAHYKLIAHRGGVVDSIAGQNSLQALSKAIGHGYWMVEIDLRITKDGVLITHHDNTFTRSFGLDSAVASMTWKQIRKLKNANGYQVLKLEEVLQHCKGKLAVMIDNKIRGNDTAVWKRLIGMLKKYDLYNTALMIGTEESTAFFTGRIKLSCTRRQLEDNMRKSSWNAQDFYLFSGDITKQDAVWANDNGILTIGVINAWTFNSGEVMRKAATQAQQLKTAGVLCFQIDSVFEPLFSH